MPAIGTIIIVFEPQDQTLAVKNMLTSELHNLLAFFLLIKGFQADGTVEPLHCLLILNCFYTIIHYRLNSFLLYSFPNKTGA